MNIESRHLGDVLVLEPQVYTDERGYFLEAYRSDQFKLLGLGEIFVQDNQSCSKKGVVRGLHFQWAPAMGKLMRVIRGAAFLVAVDIRMESPTLGQWVGVEASDENKKQVWAPAGFARGFCALTDHTEVLYKCTGVYNSKAESAIRWDDPAIGITWPLKQVIVSEKDRNAQGLEQWLASPHARHFAYVSQAVEKLSGPREGGKCES